MSTVASALLLVNSLTVAAPGDAARAAVLTLVTVPLLLGVWLFVTTRLLRNAFVPFTDVVRFVGGAMLVAVVIAGALTLAVVVVRA